jgi:hypothetical protein
MLAEILKPPMKTKGGNVEKDLEVQVHFEMLKPDTLGDILLIL